jgi:hypothetical protein
MENKDNLYLRVGTNYYKIIQQPLASKDKIKKIIPWSIGAINEDYTKENRPKISKYDSFCNIPDNMEYKRKHGNSYNLYEPIEWKLEPGKFETIEMFLNHIFGEQYEIGLDYLTIIWKHPTQILPILCLVSSERNTGKTTFLNFLKDVLGFNMTINTNEDFRNQFNSGWASKLIIGVDEVLLDKKEDAERIKNLSTTKSIKSEAKGKDKVEQEFYGKFILCSNNETDFIKIHPKEIRFWIRKVPVINHENNKLRDVMKKEIPAFLHFLSDRKIKSENKTRMWFNREELYTDALRKVINSGESIYEKEIKNLIVDQLLTFNLEEIHLTPKDIIELLKNENNVYRITKTEITNIIADKWNYKPADESQYYKRYSFQLENDGTYSTHKTKKTGRYYTFPKEDFIKKSEK